MDTEPEFKRPPGRPRKNAGIRTTTTVTRQEIDPAEGDAPAGDNSGAGTLFTPDVVDTTTAGESSRIRVTRKEPNEGFLGFLDDMHATEQDISARWGGSLYKVDAISDKGRVLHTRMIRIAGDPIFLSSSERVKWENENARMRPASPTNAMVPASASAPSPQEMMALYREQEAERRAIEDRRREQEDERRNREKQEEREFQARMRQMDIEAEERRRKQEEDAKRAARLEEEERDRRRAKEDEEREARRRKDEAERDDRRRRENEESEKRSQLFMAQMLSSVKESAAQALAFAASTRKNDGGLMEAIKTIAIVKDAFGGEKEGEGEETTMQTLLKNLPAMLSSAGSAIGGAVREVRVGGVDPVTQLPRLPPVTPPSATAALGGIPLPPVLGSKVEGLIGKLLARGEDPAAFLEKVVDGATAVVDGVPIKAPQPAAPPVAQAEPVAASPAPPVKPQPTATSEKTAGGGTRVSFG